MYTNRKGSFKSTLKKCGSYSVSTLNIFADLHSYVHRPRLKLPNKVSQSTMNLQKDFFTILFTAEDGTEKDLKCEVGTKPL
ncbi:hypothetical protein GJ496_004267, partial [Pomphorhynchus laevis]